MLDNIPKEEVDRINAEAGDELGEFSAREAAALVPKLQALTNVFDPKEPAGSWSNQVARLVGEALVKSGSKGVELAQKKIIPHMLGRVERFLCAGVLLVTRYIEAAKICDSCMERITAAQDAFMEQHPDVNAWVEEEFRNHPELFSLDGIRKLMQQIREQEQKEAGEKKEGEQSGGQPDVQ
jgi:hypothetical protein